MLLKLLIPHYNRMIPSGRIIRWHKAEGDWVDYGENLFDLRVEEVRITKTIKAGTAGEYLEKLSERLQERAADASPEGAAGGPSLATEAGRGEAAFRTWKAVVYMRVCASDVGFLRKICAREGDLREVGEVVAVLATDEGEAGGVGEEALGEACVFRAVANMIRLDEGE